MIDLYSHQQEGIEKLTDGCVLLGGVGSGKSMTALGYYLKRHRDKKLYVITTAKKRDSKEWLDDAQCMDLSPDDVMVDSWNNISKYQDVKGAFFIFDEQRVVGYGKWARTFIKIAKNNKWILLSATPGDTWLDYAALFIANGYYTNMSHFKREHCVFSYYSSYPKLERYLNQAKLERLRRKIIVEMPFKRHTIRHVNEVPIELDQEFRRGIHKAYKTRKNPFTGQPYQNIASLMYDTRLMTYLYRPRLEELALILARHKKIIVFYNFNAEKDAIKDFLTDFKVCGVDGKVAIAEWNGHKHEEVPTGDSWVYLVQYTAGSEGWNCITTDTVVFFSLTYSYKQFEQAKGRIDRVNTEFVDLYYYVLYSPKSIDVAVQEALKNKRNFNEGAFLKSLN